MKNLQQRWSSKTPTFWKKMKKIGIIAGTIGGIIIASPIALPALLVSASGYLILAGTVTATLSQLTVESTD